MKLKWAKDLVRKRSSIATAILAVYYFFLWQFDHHVAPFVWAHKGEIIADPSFLRYILPIECFEATNFYNICMVVLILAPLLIYLTWSIPEIKAILRRE